MKRTNLRAARRNSRTDLDEAYRKIRAKCPNIHQEGKATRHQIIQVASARIVWLDDNLREARDLIRTYGLQPPIRPPNHVQDNGHLQLLQPGGRRGETRTEQVVHVGGGEAQSQDAPLEVEVL